MFKVTAAQAKALIKTLDQMFDNGDAKVLWDNNQIATAKITCSALDSGIKSFGIITDNFKTVVQDVLSAGDRLDTMTSRTRQNLVLSANQANLM